MGLPICRSIVEAHSGRLWVTPGLDRGSIFHLTLPMAGAGERLDRRSKPQNLQSS